MSQEKIPRGVPPGYRLNTSRPAPKSVSNTVPRLCGGCRAPATRGNMKRHYTGPCSFIRLCADCCENPEYKEYSCESCRKLFMGADLKEYSLMNTPCGHSVFICHPCSMLPAWPQ